MAELKSLIEEADATTSVHKELKTIFATEKSSKFISKSTLRQAVGADFANGTQQDASEFMDTIFTRLSSQTFQRVNNLFFKLKPNRKFQGPANPKCCFCHQPENPDSSVYRTLNLS